MPTLNLPLIGRLGNLLFQYAHARAWCEQSGYELSLPPWVGERVFNIPEAIRPDKYKPDLVWPERYYQDQDSLIYTRKQVKEWFTFKPEVLDRLKALDAPKVDLVLNMRLAQDHVGAGNVQISPASYFEQVAEHQIKFNFQGTYRVESDINPTRLSSFTGNPDASGLGTTEVCIPSFYSLMTAPILFRAPSTFSWWASTLSDGVIYSPVIEGMKGGVPNQYCGKWIKGNWPRMSLNEGFTDLHLC